MRPSAGEAVQYFRRSTLPGSDKSLPAPASTCVVFDNAGLDARLRFEAFRSFWGGLYDISNAGSPSQHMRSTIKLWRIDDISLGHMVLPPSKGKKSTSLSRNYHADVLVLRIPIHNSVRIFIDGRMIELSPGRAYLCDEMATSAYLVAPQYTSFYLVIPYDAIGYDPYHHPRIVPIALDTPAGRLLLVLVKALLQEVQQPCVDLRELAKPVISFVRAITLSEGTENHKPARSMDPRARAMHRFVEEHIGPDSLAVDAIGRAAGASRASVYRAFQSAGGVNRAVLKHRLNAALVDVATSKSARSGIAEAASRWGMGDASKFSRACRREFGYGPSAVFSFMNVPPEHLVTDELPIRW